MNKKVVATTLGVMCILLTASIIVQYKTIKNANTIIGSNANSELKSEVLIWKERYDETYKNLERAEKILEEEREKASQRDSKSSEAEEKLKIANSIIGAIDVKGNGIVLTVADNAAATNSNIGILDNISNYLIHDTDLIILVNELKNAGAEAISINDERITNTSSITCDGNVVLINNNKIGSPFTIKAIGSPEALLGALQRPGGHLEELKEYGLLSEIRNENNITIYKYSGIIDYQYLNK